MRWPDLSYGRFVLSDNRLEEIETSQDRIYTATYEFLVFFTTEVHLRERFLSTLTAPCLTHDSANHIIAAFLGDC